MIIDGKKIAEDLKRTLKEGFSKYDNPTLLLIIVGENATTEFFIRAKKNFGKSIGVKIEEERFEEGTSTEELIEAIKSAGERNDIKGIVVQLPLPEAVDTETVLNAIPIKKDVDVLSGKAMDEFGMGGLVLPPVVGAIKEILERASVDVNGKNAVVVGRGRLVGEPASAWLKNNGANVKILDKETGDISPDTQKADILVLGAGVPGLIKPEMIKDGVVILDASTSEVGGVLSGDADPKCAEKCSILTPVPGGIGPITVAKLFENLLHLTQR